MKTGFFFLMIGGVLIDILEDVALGLLSFFFGGVFIEIGVEGPFDFDDFFLDVLDLDECFFLIGID